MTQKKHVHWSSRPFWMRWIVSFRNSLNQPQISPQAPVASDLKTLKKKKSENPVDLWCVHHFLGFIPTHVILKNISKCILKNSPSKFYFQQSPSAAFSSSMFLTKKPFTCFLKAIMRASPTKAKYSWQEINNSNQLIISCLLRWHLFVFLGKQFWISISLKGLFSRNVEFLSTHSINCNNSNNPQQLPRCFFFISKFLIDIVTSMSHPHGIQLQNQPTSVIIIHFVMERLNFSEGKTESNIKTIQN